MPASVPPLVPAFRQRPLLWRLAGVQPLSGGRVVPLHAVRLACRLLFAVLPVPFAVLPVFYRWLFVQRLSFWLALFVSVLLLSPALSFSVISILL